MAHVARNAGEEFRARAREFVLSYLANHGDSSGEEITDACKEAGIVPPNSDKAFGAVYGSLARRGRIQKCGTCLRRKGHATSGGNVWRLAA